MSKKFVGTRISVADNVYATTIRDACASLDAVVEPRSAGAKIPNDRDEMVWCPNKDNEIWNNTTVLDANLEVIEIWESLKIGSEKKRNEHFKEWISQPNIKRITFLGDNSGKYYFVGVFKINVVRSKAVGYCIWARVNSTYTLPNIPNRKLFT